MRYIDPVAAARYGLGGLGQLVGARTASVDGGGIGPSGPAHCLNDINCPDGHYCWNGTCFRIGGPALAGDGLGQNGQPAPPTDKDLSDLAGDIQNRVLDLMNCLTTCLRNRTSCSHCAKKTEEANAAVQQYETLRARRFGNGFPPSATTTAAPAFSFSQLYGWPVR